MLKTTRYFDEHINPFCDGQEFIIQLSNDFFRVNADDKIEAINTLTDHFVKTNNLKHIEIKPKDIYENIIYIKPVMITQTNNLTIYAKELVEDNFFELFFTIFNLYEHLLENYNIFEFDSLTFKHNKTDNKLFVYNIDDFNNEEIKYVLNYIVKNIILNVESFIIKN